MIPDLLSQILADLKKHHVVTTFHLAPEITEKNGSRYLGNFYDGTPLAFNVAIQDPDWFTTTVHEYCHFLQYLDDQFCGDVADRINDFDCWLFNGLEMEPEAVEESTRLYQLCELDCEVRTVQLLKKFKVPIDYDDYVRDANAYVLSYEWSRMRRLEMPRGFRIAAKKMCPTKFINDLAKTPAGFIELADQMIAAEAK